MDNLTFNSIQELGGYIQALGSNRTEGARTNSVTSWRPSDCSGFSLDEAIQCAASGGAWVEGAQNLASVEFDHDAQYENELRTFECGPVGFMPNVPAAINGLPDSMINMKRESAPCRIIKIAVNASIACNVPAEYTLNRGRALLAVIERLELLGYSVELWAGLCVTSGITRQTVKVRVKGSDEAPNYPATAFAICNAAFTRRLHMRILESHERAKAITHDSYGYPKDLTVNDDWVYFPMIRADDYHYSTPESARLSILNSIKNSLTKAAA